MLSVWPEDAGTAASALALSVEHSFHLKLLLVAHTRGLHSNHEDHQKRARTLPPRT